ncbi:MAG: HlyD family efflux transporter periplasmic adaptor subunit [Solirubrobacterales bacterium]|nr:HlyD family efflux transporter periplasmic adaptor subunit [Solirubrobacterales bacterium]
MAFGGGHHNTAAPAGEITLVGRGDVAVTVGGIGHVATLTGAARLTVVAGGASASTSAQTAAGGSASTAGGSAREVPADAVFPAVTGHVTHLLVKPGDVVVAGQPVARLADDGTIATSLLQARSDLAAARLELAQKRVQDPARGVPPTAAEIAASRQNVLASRAKLRTVLAGPLPGDVATARADLAKARADLATLRSTTPSARATAELAVQTAQQKLAAVTGAPEPTELAVAKLDLAKATLDQETLLAPSSPASATALTAADLAVAAAQQRLADAQASGTAADIATARADLARAQAEREALNPARPPTAAARTAAQLAVDAAQAKLDALLHPPAAAVTAARQDLARAEADLAAQRAAGSHSSRAAAEAAVTAARRRLRQLTGPLQPDVVAGAQLDLRKAQADLAVLQQRGAPASAVDLQLARLKVDVAAQRVGLAQQLQGMQVVRSNASGTVTSILTSEGASADATTPIVRVQDLRHLVVTLDLSEFDVGRTRLGASALVTVDALGGRQFGGRVADVAASGTDNGGVVNFPVTIALRSHDGLRPGMSARARIVVRRVRAVVRVPLAAVRQAAQPTVMVRGPGGRLVAHRVVLGLTGASYVEVRRGLRAGDRILVPSSGD